MVISSLTQAHVLNAIKYQIRNEKPFQSTTNES